MRDLRLPGNVAIHPKLLQAALAVKADVSAPLALVVGVWVLAVAHAAMLGGPVPRATLVSLDPTGAALPALAKAGLLVRGTDGLYTVARLVRGADVLRRPTRLSAIRAVAGAKGGSVTKTRAKVTVQEPLRGNSDKTVPSKVPEPLLSQVAESAAITALVRINESRGIVSSKRSSSSAKQMLPELSPANPVEGLASSQAHVVDFPSFPCRGSVRTWTLSQTDMAQLVANHPGIDVEAACRRAHTWVTLNVEGRKTAKGMGRFLANWLGNAVNRQQATARPAEASTKDSRNQASAERVIAQMRRGEW